MTRKSDTSPCGVFHERFTRRKWRQRWKLAHCFDNEIACFAHLSWNFSLPRHDTVLNTKIVYHKKQMNGGCKPDRLVISKQEEPLEAGSDGDFNSPAWEKSASDRRTYAFGRRNVL